MPIIICMNIEKLSMMENEVLRFVIPGFEGNKACYAINNFFRQYYYFNHACPRYMIMREEYGIDCSFLTYIFEAQGCDLIVLACMERSSNGTTTCTSGYPYIRLPESSDQRMEWEYTISDEIKVVCSSEIDEADEILKIERRMIYVDCRTMAIVELDEYYMAGSGIFRIECNKPLKGKP